MMERLAVLLHARDPISYAGIRGQLAPRPEVRIVSNDDEWESATVALVVTDRIDEAAIRALRGLRCAGASTGWSSWPPRSTSPSW
ncbi:hypothetical protein [Fodinicola feengrottensis]|uniref:hypothetical protein n=1 Tax=Fodinicola feengrottensis TaxID=435914 RepID=UPI002442E351|nr:hypothetical protein [Fodinicola feengrottensis]